MSLYPNISNIQKSKTITQLLMATSILIGAVCLLINTLVPTRFPWAILVILGLIYIWITVLYAINKNVNIARHVMIQMVCISLLLLAIDNLIGYRGWSLRLAIPIAIMVANTTMCILTIVARKRYMSYAIYQIFIFLLSMLPIIISSIQDSEISIFIILATGIALLSLILTILLCGKEMKEELNRRLHI